MPFNGSGSFSPLPGPDYPAVAGDIIYSSRFNNVINDILAGLTSVITRDGQSTVTGNLPMSGFKHTGVAASGGPGNYLAYGQPEAALLAGQLTVGLGLIVDTNTLYADSTNNIVGVGRVPTIGYKLDVEGTIRSFAAAGGGPNLDLYQNATRHWRLTIPASQTYLSVRDMTSGIGRMRWDDAGIVIVGDAAAAATRQATTTFIPALQTLGVTLATSSHLLARYNNDTSAPISFFAKSRSATVGGHTIVAAGDALGGISFAGSDGVQMTEAARIQAVVDAAPGVDSMPGRLVFYVNPGGGTTLSEVLRMTSDGVSRFFFPVQVGNGVVAEPSFSFTNDTDTGLYRPGTDILALVTGGANRMRIDAVGNVGINTLTPTEKLEVAGVILAVGTSAANAFNSGDDFIRLRNTAAGYFGIHFDVDAAAGAAIVADGDVSGVADLLLATSPTSNALTARMRIKASGQVNFVPLSGDPAGGTVGDVYYNSTTNKLRVYNGTWTDLH